MAFSGPLRVSPNGRYFVDGRGAPFFWLGDTAWPLFSQYPTPEAEAYLANRAAKGFNVIQGVLAWGNGTGFENPLPDANISGHRPWTDSPAHPDPAYFEPVDHLLDVAEHLGLALAALPAWGYYIIDRPAFDPDLARAYGRFLGQRYQHRPNLIWVVGGDRVPVGAEPIFHALARGLREGGSRQLISYHPSGGRSSASYFHDAEWLDFNMIQTWTDWPTIYPAVQADTFRTPVKPVVLAEGAYENGPEYPLGPITPLLVRRQAWWTFMAGGYFTYGQDQLWRMGAGWASTFDTPGAAQMALFRQIAARLPWWQRVPDQTLFASGVGSERTLNAAVRSPSGDWALLYLSGQQHVLVPLEKVLTRNVRLTWINPATGESKDAGTYPTGNRTGEPFPQGHSQWYTTPGYWEDALLMLEGQD